MQRQEESGQPGGPSHSGRRNATASSPRSSVTFINLPYPEAIRARDNVRTARKHAVTVALAKKRLRAQQDGSNFLLKTFDTDGTSGNIDRRRDRNMLAAPHPSRVIGPSSIDPFDTLAVNARRLTRLFHLRSSIPAGEPVFNMNDAIHFQSFQTIFESGLDDGALTAALSLTMSYAANGQRMNGECIGYSSIAMRHIRQKLSDPVSVLSPATIGTVLLLLGNAYRLGELESAKAHLNGLRTLLRLCSKRNLRLPSALKRAIYWQDLFSSIFLGTDRVVCYADFFPGQHLYVDYVGEESWPPPGFGRSAQWLGPDFLSLVADVGSLYANRQKWFTPNNNAETSEGLDTVQARLEGEFHQLRQETASDTLLCCIIAAQLCVYGFWDDMWNSALIPRELSTKLLYHLRRCQRRAFGDDDLFLWLVYVGKAFAIDSHVRDGLNDLLLKQNRNMGVASPSWHDIQGILSAFIWSHVLYSEANGWFWQRIQA